MAHRYRSSWGVGALARPIWFNRIYDDTGYVDQPSRQDPAYREDDYRLESFDLTRVTVEDYRELRQFLEGAEGNEAFEGVLIGVGRGVIHASTPGLLEDMTDAMRAAFSPAIVRMASVALDPPGVLAFDYKVDTPEAAGVPVPSARRLYARPAIGRPIVVGRMREGKSRRFVFQLVSLEPKAVSQTEFHVATTFAGQDVTNEGNFYATPRIRFAFEGAGNAALTITNQTTGKALVIDATTAAAGETWIVDVQRSRLYRESDGANRYGARVSGYISDLFLPVGTSHWVITNTGGLSAARIDFRNAWA